MTATTTTPASPSTCGTVDSMRIHRSFEHFVTFETFRIVPPEDRNPTAPDGDGAVRVAVESTTFEDRTLHLRWFRTSTAGGLQVVVHLRRGDDWIHPEADPNNPFVGDVTVDDLLTGFDPIRVSASVLNSYGFALVPVRAVADHWETLLGTPNEHRIHITAGVSQPVLGLHHCTRRGHVTRNGDLWHPDRSRRREPAPLTP